MKTLITAYTFDASAKQVTFTGINPISLASVLLITNVTDNVIIYNFADATLGGSVATNVLTLTYNTTTMDDGDKLQIWYDDGGATQTVAGAVTVSGTATTTSVVTKAVEQATDWTAVAQNTVVQSATLDASVYREALLHIQGALDTTTAHTGTQFVVQVSSSASGNEDWQDYCAFVALIGTAVNDLLEDNPLAAGSTALALTGHAMTVRNKWLFMKDATIANSEMVLQVNTAANAVTILEGTTNAHAQNTLISNLAFTQVISLHPAVMRVRVIVDNSYSASGSTLCYKLRCSKATSL